MEKKTQDESSKETFKLHVSSQGIRLSRINSKEKLCNSMMSTGLRSFEHFHMIVCLKFLYISSTLAVLMQQGALYQTTFG